MTGEEKRTRSKRCLSRNKRSKPEKSTGDDSCPTEATGETYTALRSKHSDCQHPDTELTEKNSVDSSKVKVLTGKSRNHNDAFEFYDDNEAVNNDESTGVCTETCSNKRKRIGSEELEVSCFTSTVSRFKRARNAVTYLKQPLVQLEKCLDNKVSKSMGTDESSKRNEETTCTEIAQDAQSSLQQLVEEGTNASSLVGGNKSELNSGNKVQVSSVCKGENAEQVRTHNYMQAKEDLNAMHNVDNREVFPQNLVCPVCCLTFPPTESMDVINKHINSCLDKDSDNRITENGLSDPSGEIIGEELFFCQLCQKDLPRMNSQRRKQHVNRCCDQANKAKEMTQLDEVQEQTSTHLHCPICGKGFKSSKSRQAHVKKCAQEYDIGTNRLLEIMHREKQQEDSTSAVALGTDARSVTGTTNANPGRAKRKRRGVTPKSDLDEETQIALALSASMAPPPPPSAGDRKGGKGAGKKNKGGNELPPLLLRDDETAQRAVVMRAAQVLCTQEDNEDDDDEISCTPALAPSRIAQNVPAYQPSLPIDNAECMAASGTTSDCNEDEDNLMDERLSKEPVVSTFTVDPALSKSFLNFLYDVEDEERQAAEVQAPRPSPLWSLAGLKELSPKKFYVPDLLPSPSPTRPKKLPERVTVSKTAVVSEKVPSMLIEPAVDFATTKEDTSLVGSNIRPESVPDLQLSTTENDECPEITPSQAVNVEMLLELAGEDNISNISMDSQQMMAASGFCVDEQQEEDQESDAIPSGVSKLLQDLSSMINNPQISDVVIYLKDGLQMVAHSFILSLRSEVFKQLLSEQRALCKKTTSSGWQDKVCLKFDNVCQPAFEVVLRHIYTGDVTIPEHCDLDDITNLAQRFKLPCLVKACKATHDQMIQVSESQEDSGINDTLATDLQKLEENLWRNDDDDDELCEDFQTDKDDNGNILNDEDIEEIMIFQTQSLKRKQSVEHEDFEEKQSKLRQELADKEKILGTGVISTVGHKNCDVSHKSSSHTLENEAEKLETSFGECHLSHYSTKKVNQSHNPVEEGNLSQNPVVTVNPSHNPVVKDGLSQNLVENRETTLPCDFTEGKDNNEMIVSCKKGNVDEEGMITDNKESSLFKEYKGEKDVSPLSSSKKADKKEQVVSSSFEKAKVLLCNDKLSTCDGNNKEVMISHTSSTESSCFQDCEPISDLDVVEVEPQHQVDGSDGRPALGQQFEVVKEFKGNDEKPSDEGDVSGMDFELENNEYFTRASNGLVSEKGEGEVDNVKELDVAGEMHETLSEYQPDENEDLHVQVDLHVEGSHRDADEGLSSPSGEGKWNNDKDLQGSPGEVTILDNDEMEETAANESITLISDNEEEDLNVSPPKTNITIVPETPRVTRNTSQCSSSKSSSAHSVSEDDDISVTGISPVKTRKQLEKEANEFLSKLKQRAGCDKKKRQGKNKTKKGVRTREPVGEPSMKSMTPTKRFPCAGQEICVEKSPIAGDMQESPLRYQHHTASPLRGSLRGFQAGSDLPMQGSPRDIEKNPSDNQQHSASPVLLSESCVSDHVVIDHSPPLSPVFFQLHHDSPQTSESRGGENNANYCEHYSLGVKQLDFDKPSDVEILETCADKTDVNMYGAFGLSTSSSPQDVMSPPVPSPKYSFLDPVSSPGSPVPLTSPLAEKIELSPDLVSPSLPVGWTSSVSEGGLGRCPQSNSPVSPSVCSFSSQVADSRKQGKREKPARKLDLEERLNDKEKPETVEVREIDPSLPLMERIRAARNGGQIIYKIKDIDDDGSDTNSDNDSRKDETVSNKKQAPTISSEQDKGTISAYELNEVENISMDTDFDFYDDGGYNFDVEEFNNLGHLENNDTANLDEQDKCHSKDNKHSQQKKASKAVVNKRKIPPSQRQVEDSDDGDKLKKSGKKTDSELSKPGGQAVRQPVTPMPNYNDMATPVLKNELNKFGVRPLPKKKMILKLKEIYDYTHQVEPVPPESQAEPAANSSKPLSSNATVSDAADGVEGSGTASSENSDEEDTEFGDCTVMIEDEAITASQQVNGGNLKEKLTNYIHSNKELYRKILRFQPLELVSLQQQIKSDGINCPLGKLVDFLDEQCITFTTAGSRPRAPRKRARKKKINIEP